MLNQAKYLKHLIPVVFQRRSFNSTTPKFKSQALKTFGKGEAYFTRSSVTPRSGLIVLHSEYGLNKHFMDFCDELAERSYSAIIAPDLFDGQTFEKRSSSLDTTRNVFLPQLIEQVEHASHNLLEVRQVTKVGLVGLSFGSQLGFSAICKNPDLVSASCFFYDLPSTETMLETATKANEWGPVILHIASNNKELVKKAKTLKKLTKNIGNCNNYLYDNTYDKMFMDKTEIENFSERQSILAMDRTVEFFKEQINDIY